METVENRRDGLELSHRRGTTAFDVMGTLTTSTCRLETVAVGGLVTGDTLATSTWNKTGWTELF